MGTEEDLCCMYYTHKALGVVCHLNVAHCKQHSLSSFLSFVGNALMVVGALQMAEMVDVQWIHAYLGVVAKRGHQ